MKWLTNQPLQRRISFVVFAGLTMVLGLFGYLGIQSLNESTQRTLEERLTKARVVAGYMDQNLAHLLVNVQTAAKFSGGLPPEDSFRQAASGLSEAMANSGVAARTVLLVDSQANTLMAEPSDTGPASPVPLEWAVVRTVLSTGLPAISNLVIEPFTQAPVLLAAAPVQGDPGETIGALVVLIDVDSYSVAGIISPITLGNTGYAELVDGNGVVLARTQPGLPPNPFERSDHPGRFSQLIVEGKATVRTCHRCHEAEGKLMRSKDVLAFAPLSVAAWGVAIRQPEEEAFALTEQLKRRLFTLGGIAVVGAFLMVWVVTRDVVRPVKMLTESAARVASGDFTTHVPVRGRDEIGQLGTAFAAMTRQLSRARDELVSRNRELVALNAIAATASQSLQLEEVTTKAVGKVMEVIGSDSGCVLLNAPGMDTMAPVSVVGSPAWSDCPHLAGSTRCACREAQRSGHATMVNEASQCALLNDMAPGAPTAPGFATIPLKAKDRSLGVMNILCPRDRVLTDSDFRLLDAVGHYVGLAVENSMLYRESRNKEELRGQLLDATIRAQEEERKRLSRELHDEFGQTLTGLIMSIESTESSMAPEQRALSAGLARARSIAMRALGDLRNLIQGLRSTVLDELGLVAAIRSYAEAHLEAAGISVDFQAEGVAARLPSWIETPLFRVAQEAINNIARHARARTVTISLGANGGNVVLSLKDDGLGFDTERALSQDSRRLSLGLLGMRERVTMLGGVFTVVSSPGVGTTVQAQIPLQELPGTVQPPVVEGAEWTRR